jgi:hypothetical protein
MAAEVKLLQRNGKLVLTYHYKCAKDPRFLDANSFTTGMVISLKIFKENQFE